MCNIIFIVLLDRHMCKACLCSFLISTSGCVLNVLIWKVMSCQLVCRFHTRKYRWFQNFISFFALFSYTFYTWVCYIILMYLIKMILIFTQIIHFYFKNILIIFRTYLHDHCRHNFYISRTHSWDEFDSEFYSMHLNFYEIRLFCLRSLTQWY